MYLIVSNDIIKCIGFKRIYFVTLIKIVQIIYSIYLYFTQYATLL